jgi:hypothetical protein
MAQPVWQLSVDLTTKTASFQTGMSDAARAARSSFADIKDSAADMSTATGGSMSEARHGVMLLGEEFGVHLPRGVTSFLTSLGPVAGAMEAAFPFLAIAVGAKILIDHLEKTGDSAAKVSAAWSKVGDIGAEAFDKMQGKLTAAQIRADELAGNHLAALELKLRQIDHSTMQDVISEIDKMGAAADEAFKQSEHGWFMRMLMGQADLGPAKSQLDGYLSEIDKLKHTAAKPEDVLKLVDVDVADVKSKMSTLWNSMKQYQAEKDAAAEAGDDVSAQGADIALGKAQEQWNSQQRILDLMREQQKVAGEGVKVAHVEKGNDRTEETNRETAAAEKLAHENEEIAAGYGKMMSAVVAYHRAQSEGHGDSGTQALRETLRYYAEIDAAAKESAMSRLQTDREAAQGEIELAKAQEAQQLSAIQNALQRGSISKMEAIREEMALTQESTDRKIADIKRASQAEVEAYQVEIAAAQNANAAQSALGVKRGDQGYIDYLKQVDALNQKVSATQLKAANDTAIATTEMQTKLGSLQSSVYQARAAWDALEKSIAEDAARSIVQGKNMAQAFRQTGAQMLQQEIAHMMEIGTVEGMERLNHARTAAAAAWAWAGNPILGSIVAPATFAAVMAFEDGGIVPGTGRGDIVPARLEPGEGVLSNKVMDGLRAVAAGNGSSGGDSHYHYHPTIHIQALDRDGVDHVLTKHADTVKKHFISHARRMNQ